MEKQLTIVNFVQVKMLSTFPSLDLALALSCFSNQCPRFHALPTWFQSTTAKKIARVSRLFKSTSCSIRCEVDELYMLFDMAVDSERKDEFLVLDGGLGTELTRAGFNLDVSQSHNI